MLPSGISGHLQALANVLKRRVKSVSSEKTHSPVGAAGFDWLRNVYFFYQSDGITQKNGTSFLHFSRNTDIEGPDGCLDTALEFLTAKFVY